MNVAEAIVKILEEANVEHVFGHPGEQIIPFYSALESSNIEHILMRHEQGAIHAADGYARIAGKFSVCVSTAGPGALNLTMGLATAFKDSVPMIVITGDNPLSLKSRDRFQAVDICSVFKPISFKSFHPIDGRSAVINFKEAVEILKNEPEGPIHINLPKNVLLDENIGNFSNNYISYSSDFNYELINDAIDEIKKSKNPLIIAGAGVFWGNAIEDLKRFAETNNIPVAHTYHAKGMINNSKLSLGLVGVRGTKMANYAFNNADLIIVLGSKLSERTTAIDGDLAVYKHVTSNFKTHETRSINVNLDKKSLLGNVKIHGDVGLVLKELNSLNKITNSLEESWLDKIHDNNETLYIEGLDSDMVPIKPQVAIKTILSFFKDNIIVNDAGSHTTWVNLLSEIYSNEKIVFSGGMGPMGYGLPAACGVSFAKPDEEIILINGDGGFQMNIQELAVIASNNLPILIIVLNNSQLGIIRQWQKIYYDDLRYGVDLDNPNFITIANAYDIDSETVSSKEGLELALNDLKLDKPYLIEVLVDEEDIPTPVPSPQNEMNKFSSL